MQVSKRLLDRIQERCVCRQDTPRVQEPGILAIDMKQPIRLQYAYCLTCHNF